MKSFRSCFTIIDILIMIALACILIGMLLPTVNVIYASDKDDEIKLPSHSYAVVTEAYIFGLYGSEVRAAEMQAAADRLSKKVNDLMRQGYRPNGRIVILDNCLIQAMIK